jgi:hypothetical protein
VPIGVHEARVQAERTSVLGDRFVETKLGLEYESVNKVSGSVGWIECKRFRQQYFGPLEVVPRVVTAAERRQDLDGRPGQGADIVGIGGERQFAWGIGSEKGNFVFQEGRLALESQILGVGIRRGRPFESGGLDLGKLKVNRARQTGDDLVLRLQEIGTGRVELFGPEMGAALRVDELGVDPNRIAGRLHRAL